jgi:hypothetical protein
LWQVSNVQEPAGVQFNVMEDRSLVSDPVIFSNLTDGSVTNIYKDRKLYIANPGGNSAETSW